MFNELQKKKKCHYLLTYYGPSLEDICPDDIKTISQMYLVRKVFNIKTELDFGESQNLAGTKLKKPDKSIEPLHLNNKKLKPFLSSSQALHLFYRLIGNSIIT